MYYEKLEEERAEKDREGEDFKYEERYWEVIVPRPFETNKQSFVVCLNTMGQDREFSEEELKFALRTVRNYRDRWEQLERLNLEHDIIKRIDNMQKDKFYKEHQEMLDMQELERELEEAFIPREGEEPMDEDTRALK